MTRRTNRKKSKAENESDKWFEGSVLLHGDLKIRLPAFLHIEADVDFNRRGNEYAIFPKNGQKLVLEFEDSDYWLRDD